MSFELEIREKDGSMISVKFKILDESYLDKIMDLQDEIMEGLKEKEWYSPSSKEEFKKSIRENGKILGCLLDDDSLIAMGVYCEYGYDNHNYGYDLMLEGEELLRVGQIESTLVSEKYRGNRLQKKICEVLEKEAIKNNMKILSATASPYNIYSVNTFKSLNYTIEADKLKYGGLRRYVFKKEIRNELF
ncbi:GNAT family N-acetyltransferase [Clostridium sp. HBUAS56017]|uniref:GNAT family N-acetyltransferase n=1 Tax=Clostridium sp. HBUAS56017 TaxID=2571128 RepID=UPI00117864E7|nr:GNAT family N-acetyltransferase [Clostridium sp. HBUAS56017]